MRRLLLLVGAIVLVDMLFYAAITPLLPVYADRYGLSKGGTGILAGAYAAGTLLGALPSGWLATRIGSRRTVLVGLALMSLASIGFAFARSVAMLDAMRFLQGIGGACSWAGGMGWLVAATPPERRGQTIGTAMSAALGGLLLGPVLGAVARGVGQEIPFCAIAALDGALLVAALLMAAPARALPDPGALGTAARDGRVRAGLALVTVSALAFGAIELLTPLRLDRLGAGGAAIAATFLVASAVGSVAQVLAGRTADRRGRRLPIVVCLTGQLVLLLLLPLPQVAWLLAATIALGCMFGEALNTPAMVLMADGIERAGVDYGLGFGLMNLAWALGQVGGTIAGGALATAAGDTAVYGLLAVICAAALLGVLRGGEQLHASPSMH